MNAETFLELATDSEAWLRKSAELRASADVLWNACFALVGQWAIKQRDGASDADELWNLAIAHLSASKMLYGLALETAFKAAIIRDSPSTVALKMTADGSGKVQQVEVKQLGVSMGSGHDLVRLAEKAGVFRRGNGEVFPADSDYQAIRAILEELGDMVVWMGRYPVPMRSGEERKISPDVPAVAFGHYMRDWTDMVLSHFHIPPSGSKRTEFPKPPV